MALNIKDPETDRLARKLAELTGESITTSLRKALQARIDWVTSTDVALDYERVARRRDGLQDLVNLARRSKPDYTLTEDEILGYDKDGIPT